MSEVYKKRFEVVFLVLHPKGPKMSLSAVSRYTKTSLSFVKKWVDRYKTTGNVNDLPDRGKTRATTKSQDKAIVKIATENPMLTLSQIQKKMEKKRIQVSLNTIRQRLHESGITYRSTIVKPLLTEAQRKKRLSWARENVDRDWSNVIFTDESTFMLRTTVKKAWTKNGEITLERSVKHPQKIHVYGCFSAKGFGKLVIFTENLNAQKMIQLYQKGLLESAKMLYGEDNSDWVLQEDNDPKHRSRLCMSWKEEEGVQTLNWPSQSPDANPIENVWAFMKKKLRGKKIKGIPHMKRVLQKTWKELSSEYAKKLAESCERRCHLIIQNEGDWTVY